MRRVSQQYDVIVVGGGVIGSAILHRLSERFGARALLVEQARMGQGSTGWSGGVLRCYHPDPLLADMACDGDAYYRQFERHTGVAQAITRSGFVHAIYPDQADQAQREVKRLSGRIAIEWLPRHEARARFPGMHWDDLAGAVLEPDAGHMDPHAVTAAWIASARAAGSIAMEGVRFAGLLSETGRTVGIQTNLGALYAPCVVMCLGAWSAKAARAAHLPLPEAVHAKAIQLNVFRARAGIGPHPAFIDPGAQLYGRAEGERSLYLGAPVPQWDIDPDAPAEVELAHVAMTQQQGTRRFPWLADATPAGGFRRFDGYTADGRGLVQPAPETPGLFWATGFCGGGFKLAPAIAAKISTFIQTTTAT